MKAWGLAAQLVGGVLPVIVGLSAVSVPVQGAETPAAGAGGGSVVPVRTAVHGVRVTLILPKRVFGVDGVGEWQRTPATRIPVARGSRSTPARVVARYFAALNARRYHAAWELEASCSTGFSTSNGPGAPRGWEGWAGRGAWQPPTPRQAAHPILASARVTAIRQLDIPILTRHHILAFGVSGWYTFDYSRVPWANMKHRNGFHVIKIAMWQCGGRWGVEPGAWLTGSGGELTWT